MQGAGGGQRAALALQTCGHEQRDFDACFHMGSFFPSQSLGWAAAPLETCGKGQEQHHAHLTPFPTHAAAPQGG